MGHSGRAGCNKGMCVEHVTHVMHQPMPRTLALSAMSITPAQGYQDASQHLIVYKQVGRPCLNVQATGQKQTQQ